MLKVGMNFKKMAMCGLMVSGFLLATFDAAYAQTPVTPSGSGYTENDPYQIAELGNLVWMKDNVSSSSGKYYKMTDNLDASNTVGWNNWAQ